MLALNTGLRLCEGGVPQRELRPHLAKRRTFPLELLLLAQQCGTELLSLLGLLLRRGVMSVALLLCTMQGVLLQADACPHLVQLITEAIHQWAQVLVFSEQLLHLGVQVGDVGELLPSIVPQPLPREKSWRDSDRAQVGAEQEQETTK